MPDDHPFILNLPELSDEAVATIHTFLLDVLGRFENQYFAQMHRYDQELRERRLAHCKSLALSNDDPPF
jgi:hypothetical protein